MGILQDILNSIDAGGRNVRRNMSDLSNDPKSYLEMVADRMNNSVMGRKAVANDRGAGLQKMSDLERRDQLQQAMLDNVGGGGMGALGVIKSKGGNWLTGSGSNLERMVRGLKKTGHPFPEDEVSHAALNNWIEGPLTKYIKRDMATEGDPVRKLAEQGILHIQPEVNRFGLPAHTEKLRQQMGGGQFGKSQLAKQWEDVTDPLFTEAGKTSYGETQYSLIPDANFGGTQGAGFNHLIDELSNALNPESGLPRQLLLTPEQMRQMGMEKAVRHVADINAWRAAQKAEANAKLAQSPAVHMIREYSENNPKGLRWVEIKKPKSTGKMVDRKVTTLDNPDVEVPDQVWNDAIAEAEQRGLVDATPEFDEFVDNFVEQARLPRYTNSTHIVQEDESLKYLSDQLKYEGDTMGHCVGGYCDDVASGNSRIFSLRDAKGEPHVTIEVDPRKKGTHIGYDDNDVPVHLDADEPMRIMQIKGKQNQKPKDEYLPFVQDFVKNHPEGGQWGDVEDLGNTGLIRHTGKRAEALGPYSTEEELTKYLDQFPDDLNNYAQGGAVHGNDDFTYPGFF